jgi:hypothetical protein
MSSYYSSAIDWLEKHELQCPSKKLFGMDCPGCGLQRSIIDLFRFDVAGSWRVYPPGMLIAGTVLFMVLHLLFNFKQGAFILKLLYIGSAIAIVINYTYKIITNQLF